MWHCALQVYLFYVVIVVVVVAIVVVVALVDVIGGVVILVVVVAIVVVVSSKTLILRNLESGYFDYFSSRSLFFQERGRIVVSFEKYRGGSRGPQGTPLRTYGNINYRYFKIMIDNLHISVIFGFTQNILACLFSI